MLAKVSQEYHVILPKSVVEQMHLSECTNVDCKVVGDEIHIRPIKKKVPQLWLNLLMS